MEQPNVNNLNGVPNFGHGFPDGEVVEVPAAEVDSIEETSGGTNEAPVEITSEDEA